MSTFADELLKSLTEAVAHARGEQSNVPVQKVETPKSTAGRPMEENPIVKN
ncbi:MAG: hypothetical protein PHU07_00050 [Acidocella sp.]|jgi:hypothetical protein|nr:hypothetical protein [Acidocella sp.]